MHEALAAFSLEGRSALLTGAASGIGRETAALFARVGARVMVADLDEGAAGAAAREIGGGTLHAQVDVSDEASVRALFGHVEATWGGLDVLVNCAAYRPKMATLELSGDEWDRMVSVTARGTFLCMREAIKRMRETGKGGAIVNISSVAAAHPAIFPSMHYDAAKAGVDAMTRLAAIEFVGDKIRVNSVRPGGTATPGSKKITHATPPKGPMVQPGRMAMGRLAEPIEIARAILFLASPAASYITGQHLAVDGGYLVS